MKNSAKLTVIAIFGVFLLGLVLNKVGATAESSSGSPTPTPKAANVKPANTAANAAANTVVDKPATSSAGGKTIPKSFTLAKDSLSEYGEVAFNHDKHAFEKYSPDGTSVMACSECHHTDQPKSALKPPLLTSERDVALTLSVFQSTTQKVSDCRACHFQDGNIPEGKTMPTATYTDGDKSKTKVMTNELSYHINCNACHDAAFKARPDLKKKPGFATTKDCTICHKSN